MAKMFPPKFPETGHQSEARVYAAFATLSDEWTVIYSQLYFGERKSVRNSRLSDGEADFVLLHHRLGAFIAEVKGGQEVFRNENGIWFSRRHDNARLSEIKDPFKQAGENKHALREWLIESIGAQDVRLPFFHHFVVFPAHVQEGGMGPHAPRELICDMRDLAQPAKTLSKINEYVKGVPPKEIRPSDIDSIRRLLLPEIRPILSEHSRIEIAKQTLEELTRRQEQILEVARDVRKMYFTGPAGTGKTVLAQASARRLSARGLRTLLLCFNKPLAERLKSDNSKVPGLVVDTIHGLAYDLAARADLPVESIELLPYVMEEAASSLNLKFDALVVDEAQDFQSDWWNSLWTLLDGEFPFVHVFADSAQDIYEGSGLDRFTSYAPMRLSTNCRNTLEIAKVAHRVGRVSADTLEGAVGPEPEFQRAKTNEELIQACTGLISKWTSPEGYALTLTEIVVLTENNTIKELLESSSLASKQAKKPTIRIETIHRFKGLEAEGVICAFDPVSDNRKDPQDLRKLAYVGLSRPRTLLGVIGSKRALSLIREA